MKPSSIRVSVNPRSRQCCSKCSCSNSFVIGFAGSSIIWTIAFALYMLSAVNTSHRSLLALTGKRALISALGVGKGGSVSASGKSPGSIDPSAVVVAGGSDTHQDNSEETAEAKTLVQQFLSRFTDMTCYGHPDESEFCVYDNVICTDGRGVVTSVSQPPADFGDEITNGRITGDAQANCYDYRYYEPVSALFTNCRYDSQDFHRTRVLSRPLPAPPNPKAAVTGYAFSGISIDTIDSVDLYTDHMVLVKRYNDNDLSARKNDVKALGNSRKPGLSDAIQEATRRAMEAGSMWNGTHNVLRWGYTTNSLLPHEDLDPIFAAREPRVDWVNTFEQHRWGPMNHGSFEFREMRDTDIFGPRPKELRAVQQYVESVVPPAFAGDYALAGRLMAQRPPRYDPAKNPTLKNGQPLPMTYPGIYEDDAEQATAFSSTTFSLPSSAKGVRGGQVSAAQTTTDSSIRTVGAVADVQQGNDPAVDNAARKQLPVSDVQRANGIHLVEQIGNVTVQWVDGALWVVAVDAGYDNHIYHMSSRLLSIFSARRNNRTEWGEHPADGYQLPLDKYRHPIDRMEHAGFPLRSRPYRRMPFQRGSVYSPVDSDAPWKWDRANANDPWPEVDEEDDESNGMEMEKYIDSPTPNRVRYRTAGQWDNIPPIDYVAFIGPSANKPAINTPPPFLEGLRAIVGQSHTKYYPTTLINNLTTTRLLCSRRGAIVGTHNRLFATRSDAFMFRQYAYDLVGLTRNGVMTYRHHPPRKIVFLGRTKQLGRSFSNMDAMINVLKEFNVDFEVVSDFAKMNFDEQVKKMSQTGILIAAHGAALVNGMFMPQHSVMVEIFPYYLKKTTYFHLASVMGHFYFPIYSTKMPKKTDENKDLYAWRFAEEYNFTRRCVNANVSTIDALLLHPCNGFSKLAPVEVDIDAFRTVIWHALDVIGGHAIAPSPSPT